MKIMRLFLTGMMLIGALGFVSCSSSKKAAKSEVAQAVRQQIDKRDFQIEITRVNPISGRSRVLTPSYALTIKGDTINSWLPYFGQAYAVPYGGGQGLTFEAPITDYSLHYDQKGTAIIELRTRSQDDTYQYRIQIFDNGSASIHVTPNNRQAINYNGKLILPSLHNAIQHTDGRN